MKRKRNKKYELDSEVHYCNASGKYVSARDLTEPGFEPWVRFRSKVTSVNSKGICSSIKYDFVYNANRDILKRIMEENLYSAYHNYLEARPIVLSRVKIKRKMYQKMLEQVHEDVPSVCGYLKTSWKVWMV